MSADITYIIAKIFPAPNNSVVLHFGIKNEEPFASTLPCVAVAVMQAHITNPVPNYFDRIGAALDHQQLRPLAITDSYVDAEMSENSMMVAPSTRLWEIVQRVEGWPPCAGKFHAPTIEAIKVALSAVGLYPQ